MGLYLCQRVLHAIAIQVIIIVVKVYKDINSRVEKELSISVRKASLQEIEGINMKNV